MQLTKFGSIVRHRRIDLGMPLKEMAGALNVSNAFLSAVELGKRPAPEAWAEAVPYILKLDESQTQQLKRAIESQKAKRWVGMLGDTGLEEVAKTLLDHRDYLDEENLRKVVALIESFASHKFAKEVAS